MGSLRDAPRLLKTLRCELQEKVGIIWTLYALQIVPCEFHRTAGIYARCLESGQEIWHILDSFRAKAGDTPFQRDLAAQSEREEKAIDTRMAVLRTLEVPKQKWATWTVQQRAKLMSELDTARAIPLLRQGTPGDVWRMIRPLLDKPREFWADGASDHDGGSC